MFNVNRLYADLRSVNKTKPYDPNRKYVLFLINNDIRLAQPNYISKEGWILLRLTLTEIVKGLTDYHVMLISARLPISYTTEKKSIIIETLRNILC